MAINSNHYQMHYVMLFGLHSWAACHRTLHTTKSKTSLAACNVRPTRLELASGLRRLKTNTLNQSSYIHHEHKKSLRSRSTDCPLRRKSYLHNRRHPSRTYTLPREKKLMAETPGLEPGEAYDPTA